MTKTIPDLDPVVHGDRPIQILFNRQKNIIIKYLNMFGEERGGNVTGGVALPALGGDEAGGGEVLGGRQHGDDLVVPHLALSPAAERDAEDHHDRGHYGQHHRDHQHVDALPE